MNRRTATMLVLTPLGLLRLGSAQQGNAGTYKGKWEGMSASGDFQLALQQESGEWKATVSFSIGDNAVPASVVALKIGGDKLEVRYVFEIGGVKLQSHLTGTLQNGEFAGKYKTQTVADESPVDEGTCSAKRT
ncbi:MAG: hypothetical protein JNL98_27815 [Bryobacterales bacterium]|nr:hypothetical protein [Bryobacterales bacterium]